MFSKTNHPTTRAVLPTTIAVALVLAISVVAGAAPVAAQTNATDNVTTAIDELEEAIDDRDDDDDEATNDELIYQFRGGGELIDVETGDELKVTISAGETRTQFAVAEGGLEESGRFEYVQLALNPGETRTVVLPTRSRSTVVTTTQDGYYYTEAATPTIVTSTPTGELLQLAAISGVSGTLLSLGIVIGQLKRRHKNSYTELFSDERIRIEQDAVDGIIGWIKRSASNTAESKLRIAAVAGIVAYSAAVILGWAMSPFEIWHAMTDSQRLIAAGTITTAAIAVFPVYLLVQRIWSPARDFVLDLDSSDVYRAAGKDHSGGIAAYSAPPSRIAELEVDGAATMIPTPGGICHLVRDMDPQANTAAGNPPEVANDREAVLNADHIDTNREIMEDMANVARSIIGYLPALRTAADFSAARNIDEGIGDLLSSGGDSMAIMLEKATEGTDYDRRPDHVDDELEDAIDDEDTTMNDTSEATNDDGAQTDD